MFLCFSEYGEYLRAINKIMNLRNGSPPNRVPTLGGYVGRASMSRFARRGVHFFVWFLLLACGRPDDIGRHLGSCPNDEAKQCVDYGRGFDPVDGAALCTTPLSITACPTSSRITHCIFVWSRQESTGTKEQLFRVNKYGDAGTDYCTKNGGTLFNH